MDDLYKVTTPLIRSTGGTWPLTLPPALYLVGSCALGAGLLALYSNSPSLVLVNEYPEHHWLPWKFIKAPHGWWRKIGVDLAKNDSKALNIVKLYINDLESQYGIKTLADWYRTSLGQLAPGVKVSLRHLQGIYNVLRRVYPSHQWEKDKLLPSRGGERSTEQFRILNDVNHILKRWRIKTHHGQLPSWWSL